MADRTANAVAPLVSAVIIARNEEAHIGRCIESVLAAAAVVAESDVVLVDSQSTDRTVEIARTYPIRIVELSANPPCCPALGRCVGTHLTRGEQILFVDGDSTIESRWIATALDILTAHSDVAAVAGREDQVYYRDGAVSGEKADYFGTGSTPERVKQLGGNGMYRRAALEAVGSFNPYVRSFEEAELGARLRQAGWSLLRVPDLMAHHHTQKPDALGEYWRRVRSHLLTGQGQVLRLSVRQGLFWEHARQLNRLLLFVIWSVIGGLATGGGLLFGATAPMIAWFAASIVLVVVFEIRSRSVTKPLNLILDWSICSVPLLWGFTLPLADPKAFDLATAIAADTDLDSSQRGIVPPAPSLSGWAQTQQP
jgi:glycosyltransferase involved in cell wall biosynthesis